MSSKNNSVSATSLFLHHRKACEQGFSFFCWFFFFFFARQTCEEVPGGTVAQSCCSKRRDIHPCGGSWGMSRARGWGHGMSLARHSRAQKASLRVLQIWSFQFLFPYHICCPRPLAKRVAESMSWWAARISKHLTAKHRREEEVYLLIAYNDCILYFQQNPCIVWGLC